jgi:DNA-binding LacI/PurR family transcriptional regulator
VLLKSKDIAKMLNISPSTVSLAINNKPGVSAETKNRVFAALEEYYASEKFSSAVKPADVKGTIVLVVHKAQKQLFIPTMFFQYVIDNIQSVTIQNNYQLEVSYYNSGMNKEILLESLSREKVAGVILYATELPNDEISIYDSLDKPLVVFDARLPVENIDMVTLANRNAVSNAVNYVYGLGHRRIGFLKSKTRINNFDDRYYGYLEGLHLNNLEFNPDFVFDVTCTIDGACADFLKVLDKPRESLPTVFLTDLDYNVAGALRAIKKKGFSVPNDFSLVGFDDIALMSELDPPITTIQIKHHFGAIAAGRLIDKIEKKDNFFLNIEVATELIVRESVKRLDPAK